MDSTRSRLAAWSTRARTSAVGIFCMRSGKPMFSRTVMCGYSAMLWNTMATLRRCGGTWSTRRSAIRISPPVGVSSPAIMFSVVVLPQPDGPSSTTNSPSRMSRSRERTAWKWE
ncbi:hypothetical protein D3C73_589820 [compost metagenome]